MTDPKTDEGIDPIYHTRPRNCPVTNYNQSHRIESARQGEIDVQGLLPVARSGQQVDCGIALERISIFDAASPPDHHLAI